jgi:hypothetical protein
MSHISMGRTKKCALAWARNLTHHQTVHVDIPEPPQAITAAIFEGSSVMGLVPSTDFEAEEPPHGPPSNKRVVRDGLDDLEDDGFVEYGDAGEEASPEEEAYACRADSKSVQWFAKFMTSA